MFRKEGIIIFTKKIKDNDLYIRVLSNEDKIVSGLVYGGNTSKKKSIYQISYFIEYSVNQKNSHSVPYFYSDLTKPYINSIIKNKFKSFSLLSIISLINLSILEGQKIIGIYNSVKKIIKILENNK